MINNCRSCGTSLLLKPTKATADRLKKQYYYTHYYLCPNCGKLYHDNKFKVVNDNFDLFTHSDKPHPNSLLPGEEKSGREIEVDIWTDGACSNNGKENAKASWAFVASAKGRSSSGRGEHEEAGLVDGKQTNNRGEALAIYYALRWAAEKGFRNVRLHSDSQITLHGVIKHPEKVKENRDIFQKIHGVVNENNLSIEYVKVLGHSGDVNNERADRLATSLVFTKK